MNVDFLKDNRLVPVAVFKTADETLDKVMALREGGIDIVEITFRTACAEEAVRIAAREAKGVIVGAGTVLNGEQCARAIDAGAKFVVSPGLSRSAYEVCAERGVPYLPGVATASEIMAALELGLDTLKFFPAGAMGGIKTLSALAAAFPDVKFMPTGGVTLENAAEYLERPYVAAVGGSWLVKGDAENIARLAAEAKEKLKI